MRHQGKTGHDHAYHNWNCLASRLSNGLPAPTDVTPAAFYRPANMSFDDSPFTDPLVTIVEN
jgi:hypothetical protein